MKKEEYVKFLQTNLNTWFSKFEPCIFNEDFILMFKNIKKVKFYRKWFPGYKLPGLKLCFFRHHRAREPALCLEKLNNAVFYLPM